MSLQTRWLGRAPYRQVWDLQEQLRDRILAGTEEDHLLLCEHDPVVTLGRSADPAHVLDPAGVEIVRTSRGGDVTAHGPGQLVIYPIVRLRRGVKRYVISVGEAIAEELRARGVSAEWRCAPAGVWVGRDKIAACGVHVKHGVTAHGFALNVTDEVAPLFARIVPCGLAGGEGVTYLSVHAPAPPIEELAHAIGVRVTNAIGANRDQSGDLSCDHARSR